MKIIVKKIVYIYLHKDLVQHDSRTMISMQTPYPFVVKVNCILTLNIFTKQLQSFDVKLC